MVVCGQVWAEGLIVDADALFRYAQSRFDNKEWATAQVEFKRFTYFFEKDPREALARLRIGQCMFHLARFSEARTVFEKLAKKQSALFVEATLMLARSCLALSRKNHARKFPMQESLYYKEQAGIYLNLLLTQVEDPVVRDRIYLNLVQVYLSQMDITVKGAGDPDLDLNLNLNLALEAVSSLSPRRPMLKTQLITSLKKIERLELKDPVSAGLLALIPGAGHLYCGRIRDGIVAFFFNSALILGAYHSFDSGNNALGGLISFTGAGFYSGSIYGSIASAHKWNRKYRRDALKEVWNLLTPALVLKKSFLNSKKVCLALEIPL